MDAFHGLNTMTQDMDRDDCKTLGYRSLHELRLLKAAAARLLVPEQQQQQGASPNSSREGSGSFSHAVTPLMRSLSNIEHVMPSQPQRMLSRTSSIDRPNLPPPPRLGRSNSAGSTRLASFLPQHTQPQVVIQPSSMRAAPSGLSAAPGAEAVTQPWHRPPRHSEPTAGAAGSDERVELLLSEVERLLSERQQLTARCCSLQKDNDQLAELVGRLTRTVQEQEVQMQELQQLSQQPQQHSSGYLGSMPSLSLPPTVKHTPGFPGSPSVQQQQQHLQRQRRVDEWLGRRQETWQEWQAGLPLEHMHSGSSSTLTVALEQQ